MVRPDDWQTTVLPPTLRVKVRASAGLSKGQANATASTTEHETGIGFDMTLAAAGTRDGWSSRKINRNVE
jgi:hypothetical protein